MPDPQIVFGKRGVAQPSPPPRIDSVAPPPFETRPPDIEEADLKLYFGDGWPQYAALWRSMDGGGLRPSWSFKAAFLAGSWLLYRKQPVGFAFVVAYALLGGVASAWEAYAILINAFCCVFVGLFGRSMVINGAMRSAAKIRARHGDGPYADARIRRAGGVSWALPICASLALFNAPYLFERAPAVDAAKPGVSDLR
jgi:hypothetical protein